MNSVAKITVNTLIIFASLVFSVYPQTKPVITVLDFSTNNMSEADMKSIVSFLSSSIYDLEIFDVIDAGQRDEILAELNFSNSGCSDETCQLEIGKLLSAEYIVVGDIGRIGERYLITAKLLETETSRAVGNAKGMYSDINEMLDSLHLIASNLGDKYLARAGEASGVKSAADTEELQKSPETGETKAAEGPVADTAAKTSIVTRPPPDNLQTGRTDEVISETAADSEKGNILTPIGFISGAVCGGVSIGSYIYSSLKYQEYTTSTTVADAAALHSEVELFDTIALSTAAAAAVGLITGVISLLLF